MPPYSGRGWPLKGDISRCAGDSVNGLSFRISRLVTGRGGGNIFPIVLLFTTLRGAHSLHAPRAGEYLPSLVKVYIEGRAFATRAQCGGLNPRTGTFTLRGAHSLHAPSAGSCSPHLFIPVLTHSSCDVCELTDYRISGRNSNSGVLKQNEK